MGEGARHRRRNGKRRYAKRLEVGSNWQNDDFLAEADEVEFWHGRQQQPPEELAEYPDLEDMMP